MRCSAARSGDIFLKQDGNIDQRCAAVRQGDIGVRNDGTPDMRYMQASNAPSNVDK
jgi:hypothetical protein